MGIGLPTHLHDCLKPGRHVRVGGLRQEVVATARTPICARESVEGAPGVHPPLRFDNVVLPGARPEPRVPTPGESATRQARGSHHEEAGGRARRAREARVSAAGRLG